MYKEDGRKVTKNGVPVHNKRKLGRIRFQQQTERLKRFTMVV
jgi:hypothetical protein